jgi:hypothetical protein
MFHADEDDEDQPLVSVYVLLLEEEEDFARCTRRRPCRFRMLGFLFRLRHQSGCRGVGVVDYHHPSCFYVVE